MKRIKKFLCTVDPVLLTMGLMVSALLIGEMYLMGFGVILLMLGVGCIMFMIAVAIGWCLYKTIVYAQGFCEKEKKDD